MKKKTSKKKEDKVYVRGSALTNLCPQVFSAANSINNQRTRCTFPRKYFPNWTTTQASFHSNFLLAFPRKFSQGFIEMALPNELKYKSLSDSPKLIVITELTYSVQYTILFYIVHLVAAMSFLMTKSNLNNWN